ncbi:cell growth regulator with RING finger domain protein 1 isoform X2 [Mauremys reevesii]|uniref:cell growth regulator with RING finger domain protein 1 isoform X2 n=1 Tax=Mauremys reevesii TaxID=260615 RepID=UPI00193F9C93|nr:cell growth regulator with RING finger domain protein 1 isoform X2 [Mauremys reevesii]XP_039392503.1 cell growth regulator with RING finger domain protein 1 isoform X2 [Mauremys reevesii]
MAAVFLVTLYEYSPLFYIAVVFVCFLVTSGLVLGWFGWDVPVILRNSEEIESSVRVSKKQMRQVKNPFGLEIPHPAAVSITRGITLTPDCLEDCILTCYWGCSVQKLHEALQKHVYCFRIKTPQTLEDALYSEYIYRQQYFIKKTDKEEKYCQLPEDAQIAGFGPVPRSRYPLVALLTLADEDDREIYDIPHADKKCSSYLLESSDSEKDLGFTVGKQLNMSSRCQAVTRRVNVILGCRNTGVLSSELNDDTSKCHPGSENQPLSVLW